MQIEFAEPFLAYAHSVREAIRELAIDESEKRRESILGRITMLYPETVEIAKKLQEEGFVQEAIEENFPYREIFNKTANNLKVNWQ